jgi:DNA uptake protein ComE-like DNA-binding protein
VIPLSLADVIGSWIAIFLTLCILSFVYKDNPFYKFAEHLFVGVSIGYAIVQQYWNNLHPKLIERVADDTHGAFGMIGTAIAIALVVALFVKAISQRYAWIGRYPLAFVVALNAGLAINAMAQSELVVQTKFATRDLDAKKIDLNSASASELASIPGATPSIVEKWTIERDIKPFASVDDAMTRPRLTPDEQSVLADQRGHLVGIDARATVTPGERDWFGVLSNILLLAGLLASLLYFYFSIAHKGPVGKVSRFGVWVIMIGFGASFGFTVQGRISLAIGRAQEIRGTSLSASDASQIQGPLVAMISAAIIIAGIVFWELRQKRRNGAAAGAGTK